MITFLASRTHWLDHLVPTWREAGGRLVVSHKIGRYAQRQGLSFTVHHGRPEFGGTVVVASRHDHKLAAQGGADRIVFCQHGNGQSFITGEHKGYAGGPGLEDVALFLATNEHNARAWRRQYPGTPVEIIGCPRLDRVAHLPQKPQDDPPTVCVSFHWDPKRTGNRLRETWTAWPYYRVAVERLARQDLPYRLVGHAHPRIADRLQPWFQRLGVEWISHIEDVLDRADVYVNDCSSTLYEFAATDRPVVVLNTPDYRRHVQHGLRFWEYADVGVQVDHPAELDSAIRLALTDPNPDRRREIVRSVYPHMGSAAKRAAHAIRNVAAPAAA